MSRNFWNDSFKSESQSKLSALYWHDQALTKDSNGFKINLFNLQLISRSGVQIILWCVHPKVWKLQLKEMALLISAITHELRRAAMQSNQENSLKLSYNLKKFTKKSSLKYLHVLYFWWTSVNLHKNYLGLGWSTAIQFSRALKLE